MSLIDEIQSQLTELQNSDTLISKQKKSWYKLLLENVRTISSIPDSPEFTEHKKDLFAKATMIAGFIKNYRLGSSHFYQRTQYELGYMQIELQKIKWQLEVKYIREQIGELKDSYKVDIQQLINKINKNIENYKHPIQEGNTDFKKTMDNLKIQIHDQLDTLSKQFESLQKLSDLDHTKVARKSLFSYSCFFCCTVRKKKDEVENLYHLVQNR